MEINKNQAVMAVAILLLTLVVGATQLANDGLFLRLLLGLSLGFALAKGAIGFAGSINRAYRRGSTQLLQTLMFMFVITAIINAGLLLNSDSQHYDLWINPINAGLLIGGIMFGAGMSLSSCCATGMMVEFVSDVPRAAITLVFFGAGVFFGFPLQSSQSWITDSWFSSASYQGKGVFLPDLFANTPLNGYFMSILVTIVLALTVVIIAKKYENYRRRKGSYLGVAGEIERQQLQSQSVNRDEDTSFSLFSRKTYQNWFASLWKMRTTALVIAVIFGIMMASTGSGWGASTPFGIWFAKGLMLFGVEMNTITEISQRPEAMFSTPFFEHGVSVQNLAIFLGTLIAVLFMGKFKFSFAIKHSTKQLALFALGGLLMGFGTRFANGCNVGALFTPIANFSLSGWVYLLVLVIGAIAGNRFQQAVMK